MGNFSKWHVLGFLLPLFGAACARSVQEASVTLKLQPAIETLESLPYAYGPKSETGLVQTGFCYALNVTAPDMIVAGTEGEDSCGHGPRGLGKLYGPFAYGSDAVLKVSSGSDRQFDLLGFKVPPGSAANCTGALTTKLLTEDREGQIETRVQLYYDGKEINVERRDAEGNSLPQQPDEMLYIFSRSKSVSLAPGPQSINLQPFAWSTQATLLYPKPYDCEVESLTTSELGSEPKLNFDFGITYIWKQMSIELTNNGTEDMNLSNAAVSTEGNPSLTNYAFDFSLRGGYPGNGGSCGAVLPAGETCNITIEFDPEKLDVSLRDGDPTLIKGKLKITYGASDGAHPKTRVVELTGTGPLSAP